MDARRCGLGKGEDGEKEGRWGGREGERRRRLGCRRGEGDRTHANTHILEFNWELRRRNNKTKLFVSTKNTLKHSRVIVSVHPSKHHHGPLCPPAAASSGYLRVHVFDSTVSSSSSVARNTALFACVWRGEAALRRIDCPPEAFFAASMRCRNASADE